MLQVARIDFGKFLSHCFNRQTDLLLAMSGRDEEPQAGGTFFYGRMQNRLHVDTTSKQRLGELQSVHGVPKNDRHNRRVGGGTGIQAALFR